MIPRKQRLLRSQISYLFRKGKKIENEYFTLKFLPIAQGQSRFCVIISTKIFSSAVKRNHLRRQIYEIIRLYLADMNVKSNIIFIGKKTLAGLEYKQLKEIILQLKKRIE